MSRRRATKHDSKIRQIIEEYAKTVVVSELSGIDLSEETEYVKDMLEEHGEYLEDFLSGKDRDGMNPRVHIFVESVIQTQIASNNPPEAREAHLALMAGPSLDAHEARHAVGAVFMQILWHALKEHWQPDRFLSEYRRRLRELAARKTRSEVWDGLL
jgi:hypothetical protein